MEKDIVGVSIFALFVVLLAIDVGQRGIKSTWGKVSPESFTEGIHLVVPIAQKMAVMDVRTQKSSIETQLYTKDIQQAKVSYTVTYNLMPSSVHTVYREVGTQYFDKIIMPTVQGTLKNVFGKWDAQDLIANRQKATADVLAQLQTNLSDNHINVTDFQIISIDYSDTFENSIEAKVVAQQDALKSKNIYDRIAEFVMDIGDGGYPLTKVTLDKIENNIYDYKCELDRYFYKMFEINIETYLHRVVLGIYNEEMDNEFRKCYFSLLILNELQIKVREQFRNYE